MNEENTTTTNEATVTNVPVTEETVETPNGVPTETAVQEAPVTDTPAEETPAEDTPADTPSNDEAPVETSQEVPTTETSPEDAPVEVETSNQVPTTLVGTLRAEALSDNQPNNVALDNKVEAPAEVPTEPTPEVVTGAPDNTAL